MMDEKQIESLKRRYGSRIADAPKRRRGPERMAGMKGGKPKAGGQTMLRLLSYLKRDRMAMTAAFFCVILGTVTNLAGAYMLRPIINRYIVLLDGSRGDVAGLFRSLCVMGAVYLVSVAAAYMQSRIMLQVAQNALQRLREELGLTISVGVSYNKVFAKLGSDYKKPDATTVIAPSNWQSIVWPLPVSDLLFVGRASQRILHRYGIETIGQLAHADRAMLEEVMGKQGAQLHDYAWGRGDNPVRPAGDRPPPKSIGNGMTFRHNLTNWDEIRSGLDLLCDSVAVRLRQAQRKGTRIQVTIRDPQFQTITRQGPLPLPTNLARELTAGAVALVQKHWIVGKPIRMLTVTALNLVPEWDAVEQLDLFQPNRSAQREKLEHLERAVDHIRSKYGSDAILLGSVAAQSELYGRSDGESDELEPENEE